MDNAALIYFSGITLAILDLNSRNTLFSALKDARAKGKTIAFDPNLRPALWSEPSEMVDTIMQGAKVSDIILPSFEDEAHWFGDKDPHHTIKRYSAVGATKIVVKNGAEAVYYKDGAHAGKVDVVPITSIVDTTAAGDSFNAAFFSGMMAGKPITETIENGCALAAKVVQSKGRTRFYLEHLADNKPIQASFGSKSSMALNNGRIFALLSASGWGLAKRPLSLSK